MPDAETQVYHQDGVHLTTQTQKPCHAINVFVPLVDLTTRNGPTEFCLGSHILGNDGFDKDYVETPRPKAGTPVIFDYRLGTFNLSALFWIPYLCMSYFESFCFT
jgi:ectoine hydroxylase-related dioxygenase (phytanoyl-CoA dioxygenase family)